MVIIVGESGLYEFTIQSDHYIDVRFYNNSFDPTSENANIISKHHYYGSYDNLTVNIVLQKNKVYSVVVIVSSELETPIFTLLASGPSQVSFISETVLLNSTMKNSKSLLSFQ